MVSSDNSVTKKRVSLKAISLSSAVGQYWAHFSCHRRRKGTNLVRDTKQVKHLTKEKHLMKSRRWLSGQVGLEGKQLTTNRRDSLILSTEREAGLKIKSIFLCLCLLSSHTYLHGFCLYSFSHITTRYFSLCDYSPHITQ